MGPICPGIFPMVQPLWKMINHSNCRGKKVVFIELSPLKNTRFCSLISLCVHLEKPKHLVTANLKKFVKFAKGGYEVSGF